MNRLMTGTAVLTLLSGQALGQWSFSLVANSSTPVPGGTGTFSLFYAPAISAGRVAFQDVTNTGIFTNISGQLASVANLSTLIPGTSSHFLGFGQGHVSFDGSTVMFSGGGTVSGSSFGGL